MADSAGNKQSDKRYRLSSTEKSQGSILVGQAATLRVQGGFAGLDFV
jgi:hypothetical protein